MTFVYLCGIMCNCGVKSTITHFVFIGKAGKLMFAIERQQKICEMLEKDGSVSISGLVHEFNVSLETVRRDLLQLERQGRLRRIHGGAIPLGGIKKEESLSVRLGEYEKEKEELSETALSLINEGDIIAIDCGSTAIKLCEASVRKFDRLTVLTASIDNFNILRRRKNINIILIGGMFDAEENTFFGRASLEMISRYHVLKCFIFPYAVSLKNGISGYGGHLADIQTAYMQIADKTVILADSGKFEKSAFEKLSDMKKSFTYVTDLGLPEVIRAEYTENGIDLLIQEEGAAEDGNDKK